VLVEEPANDVSRQPASDTQHMNCQTGQGTGKQYLDDATLEAEQGNRCSDRDQR
jgi:hypothetical protein